MAILRNARLQYTAFMGDILRNFQYLGEQAEVLDDAAVCIVSLPAMSAEKNRTDLDLGILQNG